MRILIVCHYTLPHRGGIEIVVDKFSRSLVARGHAVRIVSSRHLGLAHESFPKREIFRVRAFDPLRRWGVHYPIFYPELVPVLIKAVSWADIVHAHGYLYQNCVLALLLAKMMQRPTVLTEHAGFVQYRSSLFNALQWCAVGTIGRVSFGLADAVVVHDTIVSKLVSALWRVDDGRLFQFPLGVDTDLFRPVDNLTKQELRRELGWDDRPKVLYVGNFVARKRVELLLAAHSKDRYDLVLCGEGALPVPPSDTHTLVYPPMPHEQLARLYQASDLFVLPSSVETFAIVAYEAMACGLHVIMASELQHLTIAKSGLVTFVQSTPEAFNRAILSLLENQQEREHLSQKSAEWVRQNFGWDRTVEQYLVLYERLLMGRSERHGG